MNYYKKGFESMGTLDDFMGFEDDARRKLFQYGAIVQCPMDNLCYHDTGKYTAKSLDEIPDVSEEMLSEMRSILNNTPFGIDCTYCHSKEEEID